jgi:hypothetical protein
MFRAFCFSLAVRATTYPNGYSENVPFTLNVGDTIQMESNTKDDSCLGTFEKIGGLKIICNSNGYVDPYPDKRSYAKFMFNGGNLGGIGSYADDQDNYISSLTGNLQYDPNVSPYSIHVKYDRTFKIYDGSNSVVWSSGTPGRTRVGLSSSSKINDANQNYFLRTGELLVDDLKNPNWFISIDQYGNIFDNNGRIYMPGSADTSPVSRILILDNRGGVALFNDDGAKISSSWYNQNSGTVIASFSLKLDNNGNLNHYDSSAPAPSTVTIAGFNLARDDSGKTYPNIKDNYFPLYSTKQNGCITVQDSGILTMTTCQPNLAVQKFSLLGDSLRMFGTSNCITQNKLTLTMAPCGTPGSFFFTNIMKDGTIRTKDNVLCFSDGGSTTSQVSLKQCNLWNNSTDVFTWKSDYLPPKNLQYTHLYEGTGTMRISSYANGWLNGHDNDILPFVLLNDNDNIKWAYDDNNFVIRWSIDPAYCMSLDNNNKLIPALCIVSSTYFVPNSNTGQIQVSDVNGVVTGSSCLYVDNVSKNQIITTMVCDDPSFVRSGQIWKFIDEPITKPGDSTSSSSGLDTLTYNVLQNLYDQTCMTYLSKFSEAACNASSTWALDKSGKLHYGGTGNGTLCLSTSNNLLSLASCVNSANVITFNYTNNLLISSTGLLDNKPNLVTTYSPTQFFAFGNSTIQALTTNTSKIYDLTKDSCLSVTTDGILSTDTCANTKATFSYNGTAIIYANNPYFCLDSLNNKVVLVSCNIASSWTMNGPLFINRNLIFNMATLSMDNKGSYVSFNSQDIIPSGLVYKPLYNFPYNYLLSINADNIAISDSTSNIQVVFDNQNKLRIQNSPYCFSASLKLVLCSIAESWIDNTSSNNAIVLSTDRTRCLDSINGIGNPLVANPCNGANTQRWSFNSKDTIRDYGKVAAIANNQCLEVYDINKVRMNTCISDSSQSWIYDSNYASVRHVSGQCLSTTLISLETCGTGITKWDYNTNKQLMIHGTNQCLVDNLSVAICSPDISQQWYFGPKYVPTPSTFNAVYKLNGGGCLFEDCTRKVGFTSTGSLIVDGSSNNVCYDERFQIKDCSNTNAIWNITNNFMLLTTLIKNGNITTTSYSCLNYNRAVVDCNGNDPTQMWDIQQSSIVPSGLNFNPISHIADNLFLTLNGNNTKVNLNSTQQTMFAFDSNKYLRNNLNPAYCMNTYGIFVPCSYAAPFINTGYQKLGTTSICADVGSNNTVVFNSCASVPSQNWNINGQVPPSKPTTTTTITKSTTTTTTNTPTPTLVTNYQIFKNSYKQQCLSYNHGGKNLILVNCNNDDGLQKFNYQNGQISPLFAGSLCLQRDLTLWTYDADNAKISYKDDYVLDSGSGANGIYLYPNWLQNGYQTWGIPKINTIEITNIWLQRCLSMNNNNILAFANCDGSNNQQISLKNGQFRSKQDPTMCMKKDLTFDRLCDNGLWTYDDATDKLYYYDNSALDAGGQGGSFYLNSNFNGNKWQVYGSRSKWAPSGLQYGQLINKKTGKCLYSDINNHLQYTDCDFNNDYQFFSINNGQIRMRGDNTRCLAGNLDLTRVCNTRVDSWTYNASNGGIIYNGKQALDSGGPDNTLYLYDYFMDGNYWQIYSYTIDL